MIRRESFVAVLALVGVVGAGCASPTGTEQPDPAGAAPAATRPGPDVLCRTALDSYYSQKLSDDPIVGQQLTRDAALQAAADLSELNEKKLAGLIKALNDYGYIAGKIADASKRGDTEEAIKLQSDSAAAGRAITRESTAVKAPNCAQFINL
ncbi:hypothetical protein EV385_6556 [Krasilnikovia cinnamomea]|uniref:Small secreted protein n=1 Tax=Krasilnikovia cinnamomea TaxID=349313 RepID=A0A4Q7ZVH3_9ACTN|nr:hypothetical protein [Krasilnikovia cinnamomea]RZU54605.1 hypothetical protein EV385_6556 [Krasilnikovia cinnamomea]